MTVYPFDGSRLKLAQARRHLASLEAILNEYADRATVGMVEIEKKQIGEKAWVVWSPKLTECPPDDIPLWIGDIIHNLRSAFDILICDIGRGRGLNDGNLKFPFAKDKGDLEKILGQGELRKIGGDVLDLIREARPYTEDGNEPFRLLHDLDIKDKHRLLLPVFHVSAAQFQFPEIFHEGLKQVFGALPIMMMPLQEGGRFMLPEGQNPWQSFPQGPIKPVAVFNKGLGPASGEPVLKILHHLAKITDQGISFFADKLGTNTDPTGAPCGEDSER